MTVKVEGQNIRNASLSSARIRMFITHGMTWGQIHDDDQKKLYCSRMPSAQPGGALQTSISIIVTKLLRTKCFRQWLQYVRGRLDSRLNPKSLCFCESDRVIYIE
ncbi:hypothetical protein P3342_001516 [Pyrenophora teres f. teres]|nr:hypothetical protein P3342_001516 [Pyrenophora teres f. teres]